MLAIADSGSTKADWKIILENGEMINLSTMGFNPNYHSKELIKETLKDELVPKLGGRKVDRILFYGAGCWDYGRKTHIR